MPDLSDLHRAAREIFVHALKSVDAGRAVRRAVQLEGSRLRLNESNLSVDDAGVYAVAIGKAARPMAEALSEILGERLTAGVIAAPAEESLRTNSTTKGERDERTAVALSSEDRWRSFAGGHPLPNRESLEAARAAFALLARADEQRAPVIFLISGGGSALMEWPRDEQTTLEELRELNRALVSCGASITEINAVRRAVSAVKGGGLAARAPNCAQVSLIISDTGAGQEAAVASGPTFDPPADAPDAAAVVKRYKLEASLPQAIQRAVLRPAAENAPHSRKLLRAHHVLLDNESALVAAAEDARRRGFIVETAREIIDQEIAEGCSLLLSKLFALRRRVGEGRITCLLSGGEFACPVRGGGVGGRNSESALRWAIELDALARNQVTLSHTVALSAGTDGIDGNSPSAGALADQTSVSRARALNLDARRFLDESDAYNFFRHLGDDVTTGPTGTNVRDLRVLLA